MIGPRTGPRSGPIAMIAMLPPRLAGGKTSPIVAPPSVMGVEPTQPARKRNTMSMGRAVEMAHAIVKMRKKNMEMR